MDPFGRHMYPWAQQQRYPTGMYSQYGQPQIATVGMTRASINTMRQQQAIQVEFESGSIAVQVHQSYTRNTFVGGTIHAASSVGTQMTRYAAQCIISQSQLAQQYTSFKITGAHYNRMDHYNGYLTMTVKCSGGASADYDTTINMPMNASQIASSQSGHQARLDYQALVDSMKR